MGARRDFIRSQVRALAIGVVVGVALTTVVFQLRGDPDLSVAAGPSTGTCTDDTWWARLPANPTWDAARARELGARLADHVGGHDARVSCKTRCCRIAVGEVHARDLAVITSSAVLGPAPLDGLATSKSAGGHVVTACWPLPR